jgi:hypothetical protein
MLEIVFNWLVSPISGNVYHSINSNTAAHGRIMVFVWSFAIPISVFIARFFKVTPKQSWPHQLDNKFWWHTHRYINYSSVFLTLLGIVLVWKQDQYEGISRQFHYLFGCIVAILCLLQLVSSWFRGTKGGPTAPRLNKDGEIVDLYGDHYFMTPKRILFERIHKFIGHLCWLLGIAVTALGLAVADAPRWMWLFLIFWWVSLIIFFWVLQTKGFCIDTYQAIWGPDSTLPGNKVKPNGMGIHRFSDLGK